MSNEYVKGEVGTALVLVGNERPFGEARVRLFRIVWGRDAGGGRMAPDWITDDGVIVRDEYVVDYRREWEPTKRLAPARIFFGGDDNREMWTWDCFRRHSYSGRPAQTFGDTYTHGAALRALRSHNETHHPELFNV